jgi:hypothetical protein
MKSRLTLTVDPKVSYRAKDLARQRGISLSAMVEQLLAEADGRPAAKREAPFSERWRGKLELAEPTDKRSARLHAKYGLSK